MATSFLFAEHLDLTGCVSLRLEDDGVISNPLAYRDNAELKAMQVDSHTIVVLPTAFVGLHQVELPWLSDRKARAAIPFALEENLAQKVSTLHFAFDHAHHQDNHYTVVVIDKTDLNDLFARLDEAGLLFNEVTIDFFALQPEEACLSPTGLLVRNEAFQGALSGALVHSYLDAKNETLTVFAFQDTPPDLAVLASRILETSFLSWVASRLQKASRINLCQGELSHSMQQAPSSRRWVLAAGILMAVWIFTVLAVDTVNLIRLHYQNKQLDQAIGVVYREFFPEASQVISPRFRISQLLNTGYSNQDSDVLWQLLSKLEPALERDPQQVLRFEFKSKVLSVMLQSPDFTSLESLSERLKQARVKVTQTHAVSHPGNVTATLELRL